MRGQGAGACRWRRDGDGASAGYRSRSAGRWTQRWSFRSRVILDRHANRIPWGEARHFARDGVPACVNCRRDCRHGGLLLGTGQGLFGRARRLDVHPRIDGISARGALLRRGPGALPALSGAPLWGALPPGRLAPSRMDKGSRPLGWAAGMEGAEPFAAGLLSLAAGATSSAKAVLAANAALITIIRRANARIEPISNVCTLTYAPRRMLATGAPLQSRGRHHQRDALASALLRNNAPSVAMSSPGCSPSRICR